MDYRGPLVIVASPYAGDIPANIEYAKKCLLDSFSRGEAPFATHLLYPLVLDDTIPLARQVATASGFAWISRADILAVYTDRGISAGMKDEMKVAVDLCVPVKFRSLSGGADAPN